MYVAVYNGRFLLVLGCFCHSYFPCVLASGALAHSLNALNELHIAPKPFIDQCFDILTFLVSELRHRIPKGCRTN